MLMTSIFISIKFIVQELDYVDSCQENGAFADAKQCDKYFICKNGEVSFVTLSGRPQIRKINTCKIREVNFFNLILHLQSISSSSFY